MRHALAFVFVLMAVPSAAQDVWVGGAVQHDTHRFARSPLADPNVPSRLDGSSVGWATMGGFDLWRHLAVSVEWSEPLIIEDVRTVTVMINGRPVALTSTLAHSTRALSAHAGYTHTVTSRVRLSYRVGLSRTRVRRTFTSDAASAVLVRPSNVTVVDAAETADAFTTTSLGADARFSLASHLQLLVGLRAQPLDLSPDQSGWSVRTFVGGGWAF